MTESEMKRRVQETSREKQLEEDEEDAVASVLKALPTGCTVGRGTTIIQQEIETIITTEEEGVPEEGILPQTESISSPPTESISIVRHPPCYRNLLYEEDIFGQDSPFHAIQLNLEEPVIRIPFPELGSDIVDRNYRPLFSKELSLELESCSHKIRLTDLTSWEENWLFRKKKTKPCSINSYFALCDLDYVLSSEPVCILIPNPSSVTQTLVGDQDLQHVHDLSERNSVASLVFSSSDEEDEGEEGIIIKQGRDDKQEQQLFSQKEAVQETLSLSDRLNTLCEKKSLSAVMTQGLIIPSTAINDEHHPHQQPSNSESRAAEKAVIIVATNIKNRGNNNSIKNERESAPETLENLQLNNRLQQEELSHDSHPQLIVRNGEGSRLDMKTQSATHPVRQQHANTNGSSNIHSNGNKNKKPVFTFSSNKTPAVSLPRTSYFASNIQDKNSTVNLPSFVPLNKRMDASSRSDPCFVIKPCGASVQTDITVQFCCRVKGSRPLGVAWFKGDNLLTNDSSVRIFSSGNEFVLEIKSTREDDTDTYSCVVYNGFGEQWTDFNLTVKRVKERVPQSTSRIKSTVSIIIQSNLNVCFSRLILSFFNRKPL